MDAPRSTTQNPIWIFVTSTLDPADWLRPDSAMARTRT